MSIGFKSVINSFILRLNIKNTFNFISIKKMSEKTEFKIRAIDHKFIGFTKDEEWKEPFIFIQSADTQLGLIDEYFNNPTKDWDKEIRLTEDTIKAVNQMNPKPKFFVVCGDLVNAMPGTTQRLPQIRDFKKCFENLNNEIPLVCVCGNHDVGDTPTEDAINDYRKEYGDDFFSFNCGGVLFVVLNSQYFADKSRVESLAEEQNRWLDNVFEEYKTNKYKHLVVFQHIPWFLLDAEEDNEYFNIEKELRTKMLDKLYSSGVRFIFAGHYHRNAGGKYKDMEIVVTSAIGAQLGSDKSGVRVVSVYDNSIKHKYYAIEEIPKIIKL